MSQELTTQEIIDLRREILSEVVDKPPTIGLVGVSGVGKSSTINALFKTNLPISHTIACTKKFSATDLELTFQKGHAKDMSAELRVYDAPGLGEDLFNDPRYLNMYRENLPECDVILWITAARNRAVALDQMYLKELSAFHDNIVFGLNQVDLVEPRNWNEKINLPSETQLENIEEIVQDRAEKFSDMLSRKVVITPFSALRKYNLEEIFGCAIDACPETRRWIFDGLKNFHFSDFLPAGLRNKFLK